MQNALMAALLGKMAENGQTQPMVALGSLGAQTSTPAPREFGSRAQLPAKSKVPGYSTSPLDNDPIFNAMLGQDVRQQKTQAARSVPGSLASRMSLLDALNPSVPMPTEDTMPRDPSGVMTYQTGRTSKSGGRLAPIDRATVDKYLASNGSMGLTWKPESASEQADFAQRMAGHNAAVNKLSADRQMKSQAQYAMLADRAKQDRLVGQGMNPLMAQLFGPSIGAGGSAAPQQINLPLLAMVNPDAARAMAQHQQVAAQSQQWGDQMGLEREKMTQAMAMAKLQAEADANKLNKQYGPEGQKLAALSGGVSPQEFAGYANPMAAMFPANATPETALQLAALHSGNANDPQSLAQTAQSLMSVPGFTPDQVRQRLAEVAPDKRGFWKYLFGKPIQYYPEGGVGYKLRRSLGLETESDEITAKRQAERKFLEALLPSMGAYE